MPGPKEIAKAVLNPSFVGDEVIRQAAAELEKMDEAERLLFLSTIRNEAKNLRDSK